MNTVCLIGDSHAAGISRAAKKKSIDELDIYARGGNALKQIVCIDNKLSIRDENTEFYSNTNYKHVHLKKYNHIIIYGCQVLTGLNGKEWLDNYYDLISNKYSSGCMETIYIDCLKKAYVTNVIDTIKRSDFNGSITVLPAPMPSINHPMVRKNQENTETKFLEKIQIIYTEYFESMNIQYRNLPKELLAENKYTVSAVYQNFLESGKQDNSHLNDTGCAIVLKEILTLAGELTNEKPNVLVHG